MAEQPRPPSDLSSLHAMRQDYAHGTLNESDVLPNPIPQFARWFAEAQSANVAEPNAMTLATATPAGLPSARIVLLKEFDDAGFVFYTSYQSRKGDELAANPQAALCFHWQPLERQVRIAGPVEVVSRAQSDAYFHSRPRRSQLSAYASHQSAPIARDQLEARVRELDAQFQNAPIPLPDFWGGYRVIPLEIEFWQGRRDRLHDRLLYQRSTPTAVWTLQRLSP